MGPIARAVLARLLQAALVSLAIATLCFVAVHFLPGDQAFQLASARYGEGRFGSVAVEQLRQTAGLDRPLPLQYAAWVGQLAQGDAGRSLMTDRPVSEELQARLGTTLTIGGFALLLAMALAIPAGVAAGLKPDGAVDRCVVASAALLTSVPSFVVGALLVAVLSVQLRWLPVSGDDTARHLVLPVTALALALVPGLAHVMRHGAAEAAQSFYVAFARMRGISAWRVALHVAARPALLPVAAYLPVLAIQVMEGFVAIELVFNLDGIGRLLVRSLLARDVPVVAGAGIVFAVLLSGLNLVGDLVLRLLDSRSAAVAP